MKKQKIWSCVPLVKNPDTGCQNAFPVVSLIKFDPETKKVYDQHNNFIGYGEFTADGLEVEKVRKLNGKR